MGESKVPVTPVASPHVMPAQTATQAGYVPLPLRSVPADALKGIAVYLRPENSRGEPINQEFTLYRSTDVDFTEEDRTRLRGSVRSIFIRAADHQKFRRQAETVVLAAACDPTQATAERAALIYDTCIELINEVLTAGDITAYGSRLSSVTGAVTSVVLSDASAFSHLFRVSRHDFYTATHMVNVGTWMVTLAVELGYDDEQQLQDICQAGMLHDFGKIFIPPEVLNKSDVLTPQEWENVRQHPLLGWEHIQKCAVLPNVVHDVVRRHHERLDGSGYPDGLTDDELDDESRMCAVIDVFDAMTSLRPYKTSALSVSEAILQLQKETPAKFDQNVVNAWLRLLSGVSDRDVKGKATPVNRPDGSDVERRRHQRFPCKRPATLIVRMMLPDGGWHDQPPVAVVVHNVSRYGLGLVSKIPLARGELVRIGFAPARGDTGPARVMGGQVRHCMRRRDGAYRMGVELFPDQSEKPN